MDYPKNIMKLNMKKFLYALKRFSNFYQTLKLMKKQLIILIALYIEEYALNLRVLIEKYQACFLRIRSCYSIIFRKNIAKTFRVTIVIKYTLSDKPPGWSYDDVEDLGWLKDLLNKSTIFLITFSYFK